MNKKFLYIKNLVFKKYFDNKILFLQLTESCKSTNISHNGTFYMRGKFIIFRLDNCTNTMYCNKEMIWDRIEIRNKRSFLIKMIKEKFNIKVNFVMCENYD